MFPSFEHPTTLKLLYELLKIYPNPDSGILGMWADRLGVDIKDVKSWWDMECKRELKVGNNLSPLL